MAASRSTDRSYSGLLGSYRALAASERTAVIGILVVCASLFLPWYGVPVARADLVQTGFGAAGFVEAAIVLTVGAALLLIVEEARGRDIPLPIREGTLLAAAGVWSGLLILFRMLDRPTFKLGGFDNAYDLRYGIFVALVGATVLTIAGLQRRRVERRRAAQRA